MARSIAEGLRLGELGASPGAEPKLNEKTSATAPEMLVGLLDLSRKTHRAEYLRLAEKIAQNILARRVCQGFFVESLEQKFVRFDCDEPLALVQLVAELRGQRELVPAYWMSYRFFMCPFDGKGRTTDSDVIYRPRHRGATGGESGE
jgi:hypothetical protein